MKALPLILRDHREELWRRWVDALADAVDSDYRELVASQLGERMLRTLIDDLMAFTEAGQYERPGLLRTVEERTTADARHRLSLGFAVLDAVVSLHSLVARSVMSSSTRACSTRCRPSPTPSTN